MAAMSERSGHHSGRGAGLLMGTMVALASVTSASARDEPCCKYRGGVDGRATIELTGTAMAYVARPRWRSGATWEWSGDGECRPHADQVICTGQASTFYVIGGIVEEETSSYRVRLLIHPCLRRGKLYPVTALVSFGTDDPFSGEVSEETLCGDRMPPA